MCREGRAAAGSPGEDRTREAPGALERRTLGRQGEELAAAHLERLGFRILERNFRTRRGEIDLVAWDGSTLVFAEVKAMRMRGRRWESSGLGAEGPLRNLGSPQRIRLRRMAVAWLSEPERRQPSARTIRFDAIGVAVDAAGRLIRLEHLEGAW